MSDGTYNRPQRLLEPRGQDQRGQDQRGQGSRGFDPPERRGPASDPLLELARLIGQSDPFAPVKGRAGDPPRGTGETAERASQDRVPQERAPFIRPPSRDDGANQERGPLDRIFPNRPVQDRASQDRAFQDRQAQDRPFEDPAPLDRPEPDFGRHEAPNPPPRFALPPIQSDPAPAAAPRHAAENSVFPRLSNREAFPVAPQQAPPDAYADSEQHDLPQDPPHDAHYADPQVAAYDPAHAQHGEYAGEYQEGGEYEQDGEYEYETEPEENHGGALSSLKRRNTTKIAIAVLVFAVFGSAAAFGYRAIFKGGPSGPTPIIRADNSPTKVMPVGADANLKPINERLGDGSGERMVRRDEDPVDLSRSGAGVVGGSGPFQGTTGFPSGSAAAAPASGPASLTEPRKVKTLTIRPEQMSPPPAQAAPSGKAQRQAAVAPPSGAPMGLTPDASAPAPARAPAAPRAPATDSGGAGGYVVQLSAQKSEAEAQAAFRAAQTKYTVLSGRQPLIRKKDTDRGVFYAAQVGPFGAKSDADQLCDTLKSVGGNCFVYRN